MAFEVIDILLGPKEAFPDIATDESIHPHSREISMISDNNLIRHSIFENYQLGFHEKHLSGLQVANIEERVPQTMLSIIAANQQANKAIVSFLS